MSPVKYELGLISQETTFFNKREVLLSVIYKFGGGLLVFKFHSKMIFLVVEGPQQMM
jgi:hypothetical protein